jgi:hypothetical protein
MGNIPVPNLDNESPPIRPTYFLEFEFDWWWVASSHNVWRRLVNYFTTLYANLLTCHLVTNSECFVLGSSWQIDEE